jgi:hypothetical protein
MKIRIYATAFRRLSVLSSIVALGAAVFSCSTSKDGQTVSQAPPGNGQGGAGTAAGSSSVGSGAGPASSAGSLSLPGVPDGTGESKGPCTGLECQVQVCSGQSSTTITGKVYDPAGKVPLYNVLVFVPNQPVEPFKDGAQCDRCDASVVNPVSAAVTDEAGSFVLKDAPVGQNIPIVIQVGKWRRQITVPNVAACTDTALTDPQLTRLPRNRMEGDMPHIAITTGSSDQMECLPLRLGVDPAEFTSSTGDGHIHLYSGNYQGGTFPQPGTGGAGAGGATGVGTGARLPLLNFDATLNGGAMLTPADQLWSSKDTLMKYDIVIMSCEGATYANQKPAAARQAMYDYASSGGRVFASHFHDVWFANGPQPVPTTGTWRERTNPGAMGMGGPGAGMEDPGPFPATINQTFPKGAALAKWLVNVGASTMLGQMEIMYPRDTIQAVNAQIATEWITMDNPNFASAPKSVQYMSFNTPIGAADDKICGREVYTDVHVASVDDTTVMNALGFPASCEKRDLSAQEKAVAFMLFDLSACVQSEEKPPKPPQ